MTPLPAGLVRLGAPLPAGVHPEAALLGRCPGLPLGAVLLDGADDLGPLRPGGHVALRLPGTYAAVRVATDADPGDLAAAVRQVRATGPAGGRQDLLVLQAPASVHAGRVELGRPDRVRAVEGEAHELDAATDVHELLLPRLSRWQRAHRGADPWRTPLPPWGMRLARLVRDVRQVAPVTALVWADDGRTCRLLGVRSTG